MNQRCYAFGCFARDTSILMADGRRKEIQSIRPGEIVVTQAGYAPVAELISGYEKELITLGFDGGRIRLTTYHPLLTQRGALLACEVRKGDRLLSSGGGEAEVLSVDCGLYDDSIYNLMLDNPNDGDWVSACGIWAGDFMLMNRLASKRLPVLAEETFRLVLAQAEKGGDERLVWLIKELERLKQQRS